MSPLTYFTLVLALGIAAQWMAWRLKLPSILLLLAFGFGLGHFTGHTIDDYLASNEVLLSIVSLCVAIILFEGGLTLKFSDLKESGTPVLRLCTLGVLISFGLTYGAIHFVIGFPWQVASLLAAILVVTGPTVIAPLLRHIKPSRKIGNIVKWEGIVIDPIGAILAVLVYQATLAGSVNVAVDQIFKALGLTLLVGIVLAFVLAKVIELLLKHHLIPDYLHSVFLLAITATAFAASNAIQPESGLLTCTVLGIALANQQSVSVRHILEFKENLRVLIISVLFIVLSGRVVMGDLKDAFIPGITLLLLLVFIIRPLSIFLSTAFSKKTSFKEKLFLSCMAPRGIVAAAVTAIFALEFDHAVHAEKLNPEIGEITHLMVPFVFIIIIGTVTIYGLLGAPLARRLGLASKKPRGIIFAGAGQWVQLAAKELHDDGHDVLLLDTNYDNIARAKLNGIPAMRANILSEYVEDELELTGLGQLISTTPNDEVNSLAAHDFIHVFGSANVWQVAPTDDGAHHRNTTAKHKRGRICFPGRPKFKQLETMAAHGGVIKETKITEQFTMEDFRALYGEDHILLFHVTEEKGLKIAHDEMSEPVAGTTLYAMIQPEDA